MELEKNVEVVGMLVGFPIPSLESQIGQIEDTCSLVDLLSRRVNHEHAPLTQHASRDRREAGLAP